MDNMLGKVVRKLVGLSEEVLKVVFDLLEKLGSEQGDEWFAMLKKFLRKETCWVKESILEFINTITVSILAGQFIVRDYFKVDTSDEASVKISYLGDNFKTWFLNHTEKHVGGESTLRFHKLIKASVDGPIIAELGGEAKAEMSLAEVFALMKKQGKGEKGALLINGYATIFYIRDVSGVLRAVHVDWHGDGWSVNARSVADPYGWAAGRPLLSRNS